MKPAVTGLALAVGVSALLAGCSADDESDGATIEVVTSTTLLADMAQNVAGDRAAVSAITPANADPHDFEPSPGDVEDLADADLVLASGGDLDVWLEELVESSGSDAEVVSILPALPGRTEDDADPHWWQDPRNAVIATEVIRDHLTEVDPQGAGAYEGNAEEYADSVTTLDRAIADCMDEIPAEQRLLVTTHDALGYFAERYDIEVIGSLIPALTTQAQPSLGETEELVELIRSRDVEAVFPEAGLNPDLEEAVTSEAGAQIGGELWADTLGPEGSSGSTYLDAMAHNANTLAAGFTGEKDACEVLLLGQS